MIKIIKQSGVMEADTISKNRRSSKSQMGSRQFLGYLVIAVFAVFTSCNTTKYIPVDGLNNIVGVWKGNYSAPQGDTGLTLNVYKEGSDYKATCHFYNLPGRTNTLEGKFYMNVSYTPSTKIYYLRAYKWIEDPGGGWVYFDLNGSIVGNIFSGSAISDRWGTYVFQAVRN